MTSRKTGIGIGISTYNDFANTNALINSIKRYTQGNYRIVVVDDGTGDERIVSALKKICGSHDVMFSRNPVNRGIPYTWNRLTELCAIEPEDIAILFNNDILVTDNNWLRSIEYFLTRNDKIGTAGFPLIFPHDEKRTQQENTWGGKPGHVGASVGCCFGFRKKVWQEVENPDGSTGFWEDLISFHEESVTGRRFVTILNEKKQVEIVTFEELFNRYISTITTFGDTEVVLPTNLWTLSAICNTDKDLRANLFLTPIEQQALKDRTPPVNYFRAKKSLDYYNHVNKGIWSPVNKVIRHKTNKNIFLISQKYGETEVTEDHSIIQYADGDYICVKPKDIDSETSLEVVHTIPEVNEIQEIDLWEYVKDEEGFLHDDEYIWYNNIYKRKDEPEYKVRRLVNNPERLTALCKLIGYYVTEGSISLNSINKWGNYSFGRIWFVSSADKTSCDDAIGQLEVFTEGEVQLIEHTQKNSTVMYEVASGRRVWIKLFLNMCSKRSDGKRLPNFVFHLPENYKKVLLDIMIKCDGWRLTQAKGSYVDRYGYSDEYKNEYFIYTSKSLGLVCDIGLLLSQLNIKKTFKHYSNQDAYDIRYVKLYHNIKNRTINKKVEYDGFVYDLEVEGTHVFADACGHVLLHNTHFGFMLSSLGYYNYQLPFPPMVHYGGQTFHKNRELTERPVDWSKWDKQEYIEVIKKSKIYPEEWKKDKIAGTNEKGEEVVDRMAFSRYMFAKHWNVLGNYEAPQVPVHEKIVTPMPKRKVKWLDQELKEQEAEVL